MEHRYNAVFEQVGDLWMGFAEELPGANTQGESLEEARDNLTEAIQLIFETNRSISGPPVSEEDGECRRR